MSDEFDVAMDRVEAFIKNINDLDAEGTDCRYLSVPGALLCSARLLAFAIRDHGAREPQEEPPPKPEPWVDPEVARADIRSMGFSTRVQNILESVRIETVGDLLKWTARALGGCENFGKWSLWEVRDTLKKAGLCLRGEVPNEKHSD